MSFRERTRSSGPKYALARKTRTEKAFNPIRALSALLLCLCILGCAFPGMCGTEESDGKERKDKETLSPEGSQYEDRFGPVVTVETDKDGNPVTVNGYSTRLVRAGFNNLGQTTSFQTVVDFVDYPFWQPATVYDGNLAVMSLMMAGCANRAIGYQDVPEEDFDPSLNLVHFLSDAGFTDIRKDDYSKVPTMFTVSTAMGHRVMTHEGEEPFTLIAIGVCGEGYKNEWESNMTAGTGQIHEGFQNAAQLVIDRLAGYIATRGIKGRVKVWISGFSRAAAISNVAAGTLVNTGFLPKEDVYAYTFATPAAIRNPPLEGYENIFNIINPADLIPQAMPAEWGYGRYGTDLFLPVQEFSSYEGALDNYIRNAANREEYNVEYNYSARLTLRTRLLLAFFLDLTKNVENYTARFQPALVGIMHDKSMTNTLSILQNLMRDIQLEDSADRINLDELIDYFLQVFSGIMTRSGYEEADLNTGSGLIRLMMEHTPNVYLSAMYEIRMGLFLRNERCCYVMVRGPVSLTMWDESENKELFTVGSDGTVSYADGFDFNFFYAERSKDTTVIGVPMDNDFRVTWTAEKNGTVECLQAMSFTRAESIYPGKKSGIMNVKAGDTGMAFQSVGNEPAALEGFTDADFDARALTDFLGIASLGINWRVTTILLIALPSLLFCFLLCLTARIKHGKRSALTWVLLCLLGISVIEGEAAYWLFADRPWIRMAWKGVTALCFVFLFLSWHRNKGKNLIHSFFPSVLLAVIADVCFTVNHAVGGILFLLLHLTLSVLFLRGTGMSRSRWILWTAVSLIVDALLVFYAQNQGLIVWGAFVYAPVLLLTTFSSKRQCGRVRVSAVLFLVSDCLLGVYFAFFKEPAVHAAYMLLFYAAVLMLVISKPEGGNRKRKLNQLGDFSAK